MEDVQILALLVSAGEEIRRKEHTSADAEQPEHGISDTRNEVSMRILREYQLIAAPQLENGLQNIRCGWNVSEVF